MVKAFSHATHKAASGYTCVTPFEYEFESEPRLRRCERCKHCIARKKKDIAGRAAAQAITAVDVAFITLTYADDQPGHSDFITADRQKYMKRVRAGFEYDAKKRIGCPLNFRGVPKAEVAEWRARLREEVPKLDFIGAGERGERGTKRCHWHIVLFSDRPMGLVSTERDKAGNPVREHHRFWDKGWCTVEVLPRAVEPRMKAVRYCVKYLDKAREVTLRQRQSGVPERAKFFSSFLGRDYLCDHARAVARAGLPLTGRYVVAGSTFTALPTSDGAPGALKHCRHVVQGRMRDHYIAAFREEWERVHPNLPIPFSEWQRTYDPDWVDGTDGPLPIGHKWPVVPTGKSVAVPVVPVKVPKFRPVQPRRLMVRDRSGAVLGSVEMTKTGEATFFPESGDFVPLVRGARDVRALAPVVVAEVDNWLAEHRGPDWLSPRDRRAKERERLEAQRAAILRFAVDPPDVKNQYRIGDPVRGLTGLKRKLGMSGRSYMPGEIVRDDPRGSEYQMPHGRNPRSIHKRRP